MSCFLCGKEHISWDCSRTELWKLWENELARVTSAALLTQEQRIFRNNKVKESKLSHWGNDRHSILRKLNLVSLLYEAVQSKASDRPPDSHPQSCADKCKRTAQYLLDSQQNHEEMK